MKRHVVAFAGDRTGPVRRSLAHAFVVTMVTIATLAGTGTVALAGADGAGRATPARTGPPAQPMGGGTATGSGAATEGPAASAGPRPSVSREPAGQKAAKPRAAVQSAAQPCGGALAFGTVVSCPQIKDKARHVFTLTTTVDGERIATQFQDDGETLSASMAGPDGEQVCFLGSYPEDCVAPTIGTYQITVAVYHGAGAGSYLLGVESRTNPSRCTELPASLFSFPVKQREERLAAGSAGSCYRFDQPAGAEVRIAEAGPDDVRGTVENAAGDVVCHVQDAGDCTLEGAGPYQLFLVSQYGNEVTFSLALTRLSDPEGCGEIQLSRFGDPRRSSGGVKPDSIACKVFTASAGLHLVQVVGQGYWSVVDRDRNAVCSKWGEHQGKCPLPADGTYLLFMKADSWEVQFFTVAIQPLGTADGCAGPLGTAWDAAPVRVQVRAPLQIDCHTLDTTPGERLVVDKGWITDGSGAQICDAVKEQGQDGCLLPGAGRYRLISQGTWDDDPDDSRYTLSVHRLDNPQGCSTVTLGRYGAAPAGPITESRCRLLTVPAAGAYRVELVDDDNGHSSEWIYDQAGRRVCETGVCTFPAAGTYTVIGHDEATVLLPVTGADGCVIGSDELATAPRRGEFRSAGQYDCLLLPTPQGAGLTLLRPQDARGAGSPEMAVYDATGKYECGTYELTDHGSCILQGAAPFRVILHLDEDSDDVTGSYLLGFARVSGAPACPVLAAGSFADTGAGSVTLGGDRYVGCFSVPAGQHSATELLSFRRTAGAGQARISAFDNEGRRVCNRAEITVGFVICDLGAGTATIIVEGSAASGTHAISRRDVTGSATGCHAVTSTVVGGPSVAGTATSPDDVRCYQVSGAATDRLFIHSRDDAAATDLTVLTPTGDTVDCAGRLGACSATGHTRYQVLVWSRAGVGTKTDYQLDAWKVWAAGKPPAECTAVPSLAYGFGPYTGTLTNQKPAMCVVATRNRYDDLAITASNPADPDDSFYRDRAVYVVTAAGTNRCYTSSREFDCYYGSSAEPAEPTVFLLTMGNRTALRPYRFEAVCERGLCGNNTFTVTRVSPAAVVTGARQIITIHGTSLHAQDTVHVTPAGQTALTATVRSVSADRTTMTAEVDLTSAPAGPAGITVQSYGASVRPVTLADALSLVSSQLKATKAPAISGTAKVGATVKASTGDWEPVATSFTYQWSANGSVIKGATGSSYRIAAAVVGKRITVMVTASRDTTTPGTAISAPTAKVAKGAAPKASKKPAVSGTAKVGRKVKASPGTWAPTADSYRYVWRLNGDVVRGATGSSLKLTASMRNKRITVTVIAVRRGHLDGSATSKAVTVRR
jgi:hypothetical protein